MRSKHSVVLSFWFNGKGTKVLSFDLILPLCACVCVSECAMIEGDQIEISYFLFIIIFFRTLFVVVSTPFTDSPIVWFTFNNFCFTCSHILRSSAQSEFRVWDIGAWLMQYNSLVTRENTKWTFGRYILTFFCMKWNNFSGFEPKPNLCNFRMLFCVRSVCVRECFFQPS